MAYDESNIFARILRGEIPCQKVYEDAAALAFHDVQPAAPTHVLVLPKGKYRSFQDFSEMAGAEAIGRFFMSVRNVAAQLGVQDSGYRLIMNHGADAHQTVPHFHVHILAGEPLGPLLAKDGSLR